MKVVVLVDGEHYPPVTRWAIDELRGRGLDPIAALFAGGGEKLDPSAALDLGIPLRGSVPDRSVAAALAQAIDELAPEGIFDLSDEPDHLLANHRIRRLLAAERHEHLSGHGGQRTGVAHQLAHAHPQHRTFDQAIAKRIRIGQEGVQAGDAAVG